MVMASTSSDDIESCQSSYPQASKTNNCEAGKQSETELTVIEYEDILENFFKTRNLQLKTFLWLCLPAFFPGIVVMSYTFTGGTPDYRYNQQQNKKLVTFQNVAVSICFSL